MSQNNYEFDNHSPSGGQSPVQEKDITILGLSPSIILMIIIGLVAFGIIYNNEKTE